MLKKWQKRIPAGMLLLFVGLISGNMYDVYAASGNLNVQLNDLGTPMDNVGFSVYEVGSLNTQNKWELTGTLSGKGVELNGLEYASQWDAAAARLAYLVDQEGLQGSSGVTDSNGLMRMANLEEGIYLVVQDGGEKYGDISPFLISIPYQSGKERTEDVTVYPKAEYVPEEDKIGKITVTKRAGYLDPELLETVTLLPKDTTYYVGLFRDSQGTVPYGNDYIRAIRMQMISQGTAEFDNLPEGTYYIFETDEYGNVIPVGDIQDDNGVSWVCQLDAGASQEIDITPEESDQEVSTGFLNMYYEYLPQQFAYGGYIDITKEVFRNDENVTVDDTFYAGVFYDEDATDLLELVELEQNDTVEVEVPLGGETGDEPVVYYIYETDEDGNRVDQAEGFAYLVTGEDHVQLRKGKIDGDVTIVNTVKEVTPELSITPIPTSTPGPTISPSGVPTVSTDTTQPEGNPQTSGGTDSPKTGDDTEAGIFLLMAAFAVIAGGGAVALRRKKGR
jgi:LPXTG-motif cell wall-anchored protein